MSNLKKSAILGTIFCLVATAIVNYYSETLLQGNEKLGTWHSGHQSFSFMDDKKVELRNIPIHLPGGEVITSETCYYEQTNEFNGHPHAILIHSKMSSFPVYFQRNLLNQDRLRYVVRTSTGEELFFQR